MAALLGSGRTRGWTNARQCAMGMDRMEHGKDVTRYPVERKGGRRPKIACSIRWGMPCPASIASSYVDKGLDSSLAKDEIFPIHSSVYPRVGLAPLAWSTSTQVSVFVLGGGPTHSKSECVDPKVVVIFPRSACVQACWPESFNAITHVRSMHVSCSSRGTIPPRPTVLSEKKLLGRGRHRPFPFPCGSSLSRAN